MFLTSYKRKWGLKFELQVPKFYRDERQYPIFEIVLQRVIMRFEYAHKQQDQHRVDELVQALQNVIGQ